MIVLDASATLALLLGGPGSARVAARIADPDESLHAPHLLDVEVANALRRIVREGAAPASRGRAALDVLAALGIRRHPHGALLARVWELHDNLTAYDAAYVALAEGLAAPLLTTDARLARAPGLRARIELIAG